jgi:hypothetical protein
MTCMAYPGLRCIEDSQLAAKWSENFRKEMHEAELETHPRLQYDEHQ